jgi:purine-binding chemotaxis protein CheW
MGTIVDEVSEVLDIQSGQIENSPEFGAAVDTSFLLGIGKVNNKVVLLLNVDKVMSTDEAIELSQLEDGEEG